MAEETKGNAASLIESVLAQITPASAAVEPETDSSHSPSPARESTEQEITTLIEVYFDLDDPLERDALMERLDAIDHPLVTEFLVAMMHTDEDEVVRAEAAARLARRHNEEALALLQADFDDPPEPFFFENAVRALCAVRGATFYEDLKRVWNDEDRDVDQKREVMLGMESLDLARTLNDLLAYIDNCCDIDAIQEDQLELAMMIFARHEHRDAIPNLRRLQERLRATQIDGDDKRELLDMVQEGIELLADAAGP